MPEPDERDDESPIESPPEGSACAEHPERPALAVCPRCGSYACLACWHHAVRRCHACLMRDPSAAAPPIPWEDRSRSAPAGYLATLATVLRPIATAPAFARDGIQGARTFWALSFLPLALVAGIIPFTHTLVFGPSFAVRVIGGADATAIALDVARASGLGLAVAVGSWLAVALPYVSLARAYAEKGYELAPLRVVLYHAFLLPLSMVLFHALGTGLPEPAPDAALTMTLLVSTLPLVLLLWSLRATARMASGAGPFASHLVAVVPFVVMVLAFQFLLRAVEPFAPDSAQIEQAVEQAGGR